MTARATAPDRAWDPVRFHRGSRGLAAFITIINGLAVLAFGVLVVPLSGVDATLGAWLSIVAIATGIGHVVAVFGLIRGQTWSGRLVAYLAAGGIGASVFALLLITRAGEAILGAGDASSVGYLVWMIGSWLVAARFALKPFRPAAAPRRSRSGLSTSPLAQGLAPWVAPRPATVAGAA